MARTVGGVSRTSVVTGRQVWPTIARLSKKAGPRYAAIAYLGREAPKLLTMRRGDVLVVNAGPQALTAGATHPEALAVFVERGVQVFSLPNLHSKVFVNRDTAVVGSANASANSARVEEAIVVLTTVTARRDVRAYVERLVERADEVDDAFLSMARNQFKVPVDGPVPGITSSGGRVGLVRDPVSAVWIVDFERVPFASSDNEFAVSSERRYRRKQLSGQFRVEAFNDGKKCYGVAIGDAVIFVEELADEIVVHPPQIVLDVESKNPDSGNWFMFTLADQVPPSGSVTWASLRRTLGFPRLESAVDLNEPVMDAGTVRSVLRLWGLESNPS